MPDINEGVMTDLSAQAQAMTGQPAVQQPWVRPVGFDAATALFGPGRPMAPLYPEEKPRLFEYQPGVNLVSIPRSGFGLASFPALRNLAASCKEIRLNIELIKREIRALEWDIVPSSKKAIDDGADEVRAFFEAPDGEHEFDQWINILLEEMLVIDAPCVYPDVDEDGRLKALEIVSGDTIRPILDIRGRISAPPLPAYIQMIHSTPMSWFTRDRLVYRPFNTSAYSPYGISPIEFIILTVNLALRRETFHVASFTEGNIPEALVGAPASWTQDQIETWQKWWDALLAGKVSQQVRIKWVPLEGGRGSIPVYEFRKDDITSTARDEWLMRVACWAFGNSPAEFGITPNQGLGGKGFTESMENVQYRSMIGPVAQFLARFLTRIIHKRLKRPNLMFKWLGFDPQEDQLQQAQIDQFYVGLGAYDLNYVQERLGIPEENRPKHAPAQPGLAVPGLGQFVPAAQALNAAPGSMLTEAELRGGATRAPTSRAQPQASQPALDLEVGKVQAAMDIVKQVTSGEVTRESGLSSLKILLGLSEAQANELLGNAGTTGATVVPAKEVTPVGGSPIGKFFRARTRESAFADYG